MSLIQMSVSGGIMILVVAAVRFVAINRLPKRAFLLFWGAILLRLLIPFSVSSALSAYTVIDKNPAIQEILTEKTAAGLFMQEIDGLEGAGELQGTGETQSTGEPHTAEGSPAIKESHTVERLPATEKLPALSVWHTLWIVGVTVCGIFFAVSYIRCYLEFRTSLPVRNEFANEWLKEHRIKRKIQIRESDRILTPLTYGIFHPVILMPKKTDWEDRQQLQYILQHEYMHVCRFDMIWKLAAAFALCIHWFNPAAWVMYLLFNRDIEISCDESVVRQFGEMSRSAYARTLIALEEKKSGLAPFYSSFSKNVMEERITAIMKTKKATVWSVVISVLVLIAIVALFATSAANDSEAIPHGKSEQTQESMQDTEQDIRQGAGQDMPNSAERLFPLGTALPSVNFNYAVSAFYEEEAVVIVESPGDTVLNTIPLISDTWEIFLYMENEDSGYLLCCGSPGLGQMTKLLYATDDRWSTYSEKDISFLIDGYPTSISVSPEGDIYIGTQMRSNGYMFVSEDEGEHWNPIRTDNGRDRENGYYRWGYAPFFDRENQLVYVILEYDGSYYLYQSDGEMKEWERAGMFSLSELNIIEENRNNGQYQYILEYDGSYYLYQSDEKINEWENTEVVPIDDRYMIEKYWISERHLYIVDSGGNSFQFEFD